MKNKDLRSDCPINNVLEILGDKWTFLIIRDVVFEGKKFYKDFLNSQEGIATNILSNRLKGLEHAGIIQSQVYEKQRTMKVYSLTAKGIDLIPVLFEMIIWSAAHGEGLKISQEFVEKIRTHRDSMLELVGSCIGTTTFSANQPSERNSDS